MSSTTRHSIPDPTRFAPGGPGQVLVLFALSVFVILVVAALAFDAGTVLVERRDQQNAADAAALAGARYAFDADCEAPDWTCLAAREAALRIARVNGFDDVDPNEVVQVHIPAIHGRYIGMPHFVEVEIDSTRASIFAGVIGKTTWDVGAFAVATPAQNPTFPFSMIALNRTACNAIQVTGGGVVEAFDNIQSNSNGTECGSGIGFLRTGGSTINVIADDATCRSAGLIQDRGSGSMTCTPVQNSFALPDPLLGLPAPAKPGLAAPMVHVGTAVLPGDGYPKSCPGDTDSPPDEATPSLCKLAQTGAWDGQSWILYPGLYPGGLEITANTTAYLMPGLYWIGGGGLRVATGGTIMSISTEVDATANPGDATWGGGVLLYNSFLPVPGGEGGNINFDGSSATLLLKMLCTGGPGQAIPPETGCLEPPDESNPNHIYDSMSIFQNRSLTNSITLNGSASGAEVEGIIYAPGGIVTLNGNGGLLVVDQIIADQFNVMGNSGTIRVLKRAGLDAVITAAGLVD